MRGRFLRLHRTACRFVRVFALMPCDGFCNVLRRESAVDFRVKNIIRKRGFSYRNCHIPPFRVSKSRGGTGHSWERQDDGTTEFMMPSGVT